MGWFVGILITVGVILTLFAIASMCEGEGILCCFWVVLAIAAFIVAYFAQPVVDGIIWLGWFVFQLLKWALMISIAGGGVFWGIRALQKRKERREEQELLKAIEAERRRRKEKERRKRREREEEERRLREEQEKKEREEKQKRALYQEKVREVVDNRIIEELKDSNSLATRILQQNGYFDLGKSAVWRTDICNPIHNLHKTFKSYGYFDFKSLEKVLPPPEAPKTTLSETAWVDVYTLYKEHAEQMTFTSFVDKLRQENEKMEFVERQDVLMCRSIDQRFYRGQLKDYMGSLSDEVLSSLAKVVAKEDWRIPGKPDAPYALLRNYLFQTFKRAYYENKICASERFLIFNTGLYDKSRRNVYYGLLEKRENGAKPPYSFYAWRPEKHIPEWKGELPKSANYLIQPYNPQLEHKIDLDHIGETNKGRIDFLANVSESGQMPLLDGCIQDSIRRAKARDFAAIPTYYTSKKKEAEIEKVQYLIPLYYDNVPRAALVLNPQKDRYDIETVLTLEMAYQNARVINNINHTWLGNVFSQKHKDISEPLNSSKQHAPLNDMFDVGRIHCESCGEWVVPDEDDSCPECGCNVYFT